MPQKTKSHIPTNTLPSGVKEGIIIARAAFNGSPDSEEVEQSHRDSGHLFILQEKGKTHIEIDFKKHIVKAPSIIYIHPSQVHRLISFEKAEVCSWIITSENIHPEYLNFLENFIHSKALPLKEETLSVISRTASLCIEFSERENEKLYNYILKESCNTLIALVLSQYSAQANKTDHNSRFEIITNAFKSLLENNFTTMKSPAAYAEKLNISTPYLNECIKTVTGNPVSHHIQERIILEAKRLLYHSNKSVKEIAADLGYDDYSYFNRLFVKGAGMTPLAFRNKNQV